MKLYYKPTSPYARKVTVVAIEAGVMDRIQAMDTPIRDPSTEFWKINPTGMIPALITEDGELVVESNFICDYLDSLNKGTRLFPSETHARLRMFKLTAFGQSVMDAYVARYREAWRPEESRDTKKLALETERISNILDGLEAESQLLDGPVNFGHVTLACALSLGERKFPAEDWRVSRPRVAKWFEAFKERPSMTSTYAE